MPSERQVEVEGGKERAFDTVGLAEALASADVAPVRFVKRRRAKDPLGWGPSLGHLTFVVFVLALSLGAPTLAAQIAVVGLALSYAALFASSKRSPDREVEIEVDDLGVRQTSDHQVRSIAWPEIKSYVTPVMSLDAIGLRDGTGRVALILGDGIGDAQGPVTERIWRALAKIVRDRVPHDGSASDPEWRRRLALDAYRLGLVFAGIGFTLAPSLARVGDRKGGEIAALVILGAVVVLAVLGPIAISRSLAGRDGTAPFESAVEETPLSRFLAARRYRLEAVSLEVGHTYRYAEGKLLGRHLHLNRDPTFTYFPFMALWQVLRLVPDIYAYVSFGLLALVGIYHLMRSRYLRALTSWTGARISVEDGEVVVRQGKREERFPLASAETVSLRPEWVELGGEATLYRNGRRILVVDRRFLVAEEREVAEDRAQSPL